MMRSIAGLLCLIVCGLAGTVVNAITLETYSEWVRASHPFFEKEALQVEIERMQRDRFLGGRDWVASASPVLGYQEPVENSVFAPERVYFLGLEGALERTFWSNGARLSVGWKSSYSDQRIPGIAVPTPGGAIDIPTASSRFYENRVFAAYSLPLWQNRGGHLDRLDYELQDYDIDLSRVRALENQELFLLDVCNRFLDWVLLGEQVTIDEARLRFAEEQLEQVMRKRRVNLVDEVDVLRAKDAVQGAEERLVLARSRFRSQRSALAVLAGRPDVAEASPDEDLGELRPPPEIDSVIAQLDRQRVLRELGVRRRQLERARASIEDVIRPQLFLTFQGALQEGDDGFFDAWLLDRPDVAVSLDFRHPLGARSARADVARTKLEIRQLDRQMESIRLDLEAELRRIIVELDELETVLALNREQIETARRKTAEERKLYNQGRGELTFVLQSRDREALAELTYAVNAVSYQRLTLQMRELLDELLPTP